MEELDIRNMEGKRREDWKKEKEELHVEFLYVCGGMCMGGLEKKKSRIKISKIYLNFKKNNNNKMGEYIEKQLVYIYISHVSLHPIENE